MDASFANMFGNEFKKTFPKMVVLILVAGTFFTVPMIMMMEGGLGLMALFYVALIVFSFVLSAFRSLMKSMDEKRLMES